jgi:NAD-dependent dihydropyrimidine dehydrogenase PreA subunit
MLCDNYQKCIPYIHRPCHGFGLSATTNLVAPVAAEGSELQAYMVLSNERTKEMYDVDLEGSRLEESLGFQNKAFSEWLPETRPSEAMNHDPAENRALFVDERTCIGCKSCVWQACRTLEMDEEHGRARVMRQWADSEASLQAAVGG